MKKIWIVDPANAKAMEQIRGEVAECLPEEKMTRVMLILEEAFMNIAWHAYGEERSKPIAISFNDEKECVLLTLMDMGREFDPTKHHAGTPSGSEVGGNGIRIIRGLSEDMKYERTVDGKNKLSIWI